MNFIDFAHASGEVLATESTNETGALSNLGINGPLFISQLFNFAVVATIVWFLILKPLTKKMSERQKMIDDSIANAKKIEQTLQKSEQKYQARIDEAKVEANKILDRAATETGQITEAMKIKAKQEIELLIEHAKRNIVAEKEAMVAGLKKETAGFIIAALEKILTEKMDNTKDKELIAEMIKKME